MMTHRERILHRILKRHFIGAILTIKNALVSKIKLFDTTADISLENLDSNKDRLIMDYGDSFYTFDIVYDLRKTDRGDTQYVIVSID